MVCFSIFYFFLIITEIAVFFSINIYVLQKKNFLQSCADSWILGRRHLLNTVVCMLLTMMNLGTLSLIALIANYLCEAIMFPTIFSLAVQDLDSQQKKSAASLLMMTPIGGCGFLLMGYLADHTNPFIPFIIPLIGYAVVLAYAARLNKR